MNVYKQEELVTKKYTIILAQPTFLPMTFRSLSETFIRRSMINYSSGFATIVMPRGKKSVVRVAERVATLVPVFSASRVQHISDLHPKFALRPHNVWRYGTLTVCDG